mmetsp:Transcript_33893/g.71869  ORF Transcript_33893/g.71869 Transcript_33893/m.71869 type:complete len:125 (+) Transcript_33893:439-813(+)
MMLQTPALLLGLEDPDGPPNIDAHQDHANHKRKLLTDATAGSRAANIQQTASAARLHHSGHGLAISASLHFPTRGSFRISRARSCRALRSAEAVAAAATAAARRSHALPEECTHSLNEEEGHTH